MNTFQQTQTSAPLFTDDTHSITVTSKLFKYGAQTFPINSISKVSAFDMPFEFGGMFINGIGCLIGLWLIFMFNGWSILGLIAVGICGFNIKNMSKKDYIVKIEFHSSEDITISSKDKMFAISLRDALQEAISMN